MTNIPPIAVKSVDIASPSKDGVFRPRIVFRVAMHGSGFEVPIWLEPNTKADEAEWIAIARGRLHRLMLSLTEQTKPWAREEPPAPRRDEDDGD